MWQNTGVMIKAQLIDSSISIFLSSKNILILPGHISSHHNQGVEHIHSLLQTRAASWVYKAHPALWVRRTDWIHKGITPASLHFDVLSSNYVMKYR